MAEKKYMAGSILSVWRNMRKKQKHLCSYMYGGKNLPKEKEQNASPTFRASRLERW